MATCLLKRTSCVFSSLLFLSSLADATLVRNRRETSDYVVDTLVVVDDIVFNRWVSEEPASKTSQQRQDDASAKLKTYVSLLIHQTNARLKTLGGQSQGWTVQMSIAKILLDTNPLGTAHPVSKRPDARVPIDSTLALNTLKIWAATNSHAAAYDHVLLLTRENLGEQSETMFNSQVRGRAFVGTMCQTDGDSVSVVEEIGGFQSSVTIAHELAHSLGSIHDGEGSSSDCPNNDRYIMAATLTDAVTPSTMFNPWFFSRCSARSIKTFLATPEASCLSSNLPTVPEFTNSQNILPGLQDDGNAQCQMIYGTNSRLCLGGNFGSLEDMCNTMYCLDTSSSTSSSIRCVEHRAGDGTPCANGKICQQGRCVTDSRGPTSIVDSDCPLGDSVVPINGQSCANYISSQPSACYSDNIRTLCCSSCKTVRKDSQACPYGDRKTGCEGLQDFCRSVRADGTRFDKDCCDTCNYDTPAPCVDMSSIDGVSCSRYLQLGGVQGCYNASLAYLCCRSCAEQRTGSTGCEYGDRYVDNTCSSLTSRGQTCSGHEKLCCKTCSKDDKTGSAPLRTSSYKFLPLIVLLVLVLN